VPASSFDDPSYELRRLFAELLGTFFLVLVAVGGAVVNARFGGAVIPLTAQATAPGLMVAALILSIGAVSGAHLNPGVSVAFALRGHDARNRPARATGHGGSDPAGIRDR